MKTVTSAPKVSHFGSLYWKVWGMVFFCFLMFIPKVQATDFPGPLPGSATLTTNGSQYSLANDILKVTYLIDSSTIGVNTIEDSIHGTTNPLQIGELFKLVLDNGTVIDDNSTTVGVPAITQIVGDSQNIQVSARSNGWKVTVPLTYTNGGNQLDLLWSATLRDGSNYIIHELSYTAAVGNWFVKEIHMVDFTAASPQIVGVTKGSPIFAGQFFIAQQTPVAETSVSGGVASSYLERGDFTLEGQSFSQSAALGLYPNDQKRRGFQYYLERERAQEHFPLLHYNSWWDLLGNELSDTTLLDRINTFGQELVVNRGVPLKNFIIDDGYEDFSSTASTIWELDPNRFPNGLVTTKNAAATFGASMGVWMSPMGGYGGRNTRIDIARRADPQTETQFVGGSEYFKLSGPHYYELFKNAVFKKQNVEGVKHFKFDGTQGVEDFHSLLQLTQDMRQNNPETFINATVGTWGSPYFMWYVDSIWRQGADAKGEADATRDQQVTYRDLETYNITKNNPMLPVNSLMVHGIGQGRYYQGKSYSHDANGNLLDMNDPAVIQDFREEVRNYFAQGFNLQELYITPTPDYMTPTLWDVLAEAALWGQANHEVLLDSRYIGGNPGQNEVYGVASWSKDKAILMLRNPSNSSQSITLNPIEAFELPSDAYTNFVLRDPFDASAPEQTFAVAEQKTFTVPASSILLFEAFPQGPSIQLEAISKASWSLVSVTSEETSGENGAAANAFDNNPATIWHTNYSSNQVSHPHELIIDLGQSYDKLTSLKYLPRQDGGINGTIKGYEIYLSDSLSNFGSPLATGNWTSSTLEKSAMFPESQGRYLKLVSTSEINGYAWTTAAEITLYRNAQTTIGTDARYVRLVALSEVNGGPWTSMAELNVLSNGTPLDRAAWNVTVDSQETASENGVGSNVADGNTSTIWHTSYSSGSSGYPHQIDIDLGTVQSLSGLRYLPRQDGGIKGTIAGYAVYLSTDGTNWGTPLSSGTFSADTTEKEVLFPTAPPVSTYRYARLVATSEINGYPWTTVAELNLLENGNPISQAAWTLQLVDSEETTGENGAAINAFDGDNSTIWHTQYIGSSPTPPHEIQIDLGANYDVSGFRYLPRQIGTNGTIAGYEFYLSNDGQNWGALVATGTFASDTTEKQVNFN